MTVKGTPLVSAGNSRNATFADAFTHLRADYNAAKNTRHRRRLTGVSGMGSGGDYHYRLEADFLKIMEWARSFDRNDPVVGQGITRLIRNVVQQGIKLDVVTGAESLNAELSSRWDAWRMDPNQCDRAGEQNLHGLSKLVLRAAIVDGDIVVLPNKNGSLQAIEAHRLRTPRSTTRNVVHGVLLDENRRRLEYWIAREGIEPHQQVPKVGDVIRFAARDATGHRQVFHIYNPKRVSQTRGVSALAPVVDVVGMHDDIQFAKLVQQQIVSCFAILRSRDIGFGGGKGGQLGEQTTEALGDGSTRTIEGIAPGMDVSGLPGETLTGFSPNVPNPEFFKHAMMVLTFIAINLDLPLAVFLLDPSETNFSGWRGAMDQARIGFRDMQAWLVDGFYRPVYEWKVRQWLHDDERLRKRAGYDLVDGRLVKVRRFGVKAFEHRWSPPTWAYIEPAKDAKADSMIVDSRLNSRRGVLNRRGMDIDEIDKQIVNDNAALIEASIVAAEGINSNHADAMVDWREIAGFPAVGSVQQDDDDDNANDKKGQDDAK